MKICNSFIGGKNMDKKTIGERMKELRMNKGMTNGQLANRLGCSRNTITNYETGQTPPSLEIIQEYHQFFGVSYEYLIDGKEYSNEDFVNEFEKLPRRKQKFIMEMIKSLSDL
jgi:transcriptional regulator with XRE-family HTH domain